MSAKPKKAIKSLLRCQVDDDGVVDEVVVSNWLHLEATSKDTYFLEVAGRRFTIRLRRGLSTVGWTRRRRILSARSARATTYCLSSSLPAVTKSAGIVSPISGSPPNGHGDNRRNGSEL